MIAAKRLRLFFNIISHKFYSGQGLHLNILLTKRSYNLKVETIWEDYALVEIEGLSGTKNYSFQQQGLSGEINDIQLEENLQQKIDINLKLPEYSSYSTKIYGSINHIAQFVDSKLRGPKFQIEVLSKNSTVNLKYIQAQKFNLKNPLGKVNLSTLICGDATINAKELDAQKVMISRNIAIQAEKAYLRSLLLQNSAATINTQHFKCDSIQGKTAIYSKEKVIVDRWYAGPNEVMVQSKNYQINIQNGTGKIKGNGTLVLGKNHKGIVKDISSNEKQIV